MKKARFIFACTAAGIALTAFGAPAAIADSATGTLAFSPGAVAPGQYVSISATCDDPNYQPNPVVSRVLDESQPLTGGKNDKGVWQLGAKARVRDDAAPGRWPAFFACGDTMVESVLQVTKAEPPVLEPEITVDPNKGLSGAKVEILLLCGDETSVTSAALNIGKLEPLPKKDGDVHPWLRATGTIQDVKPGDYPVVMNCGGKEFTTNVTVLAKGAPAPQAQVPVKPKGAADTGSLDAAPAPADDTNLYVLGGAALALLGAGGWTGARAYRKRQRA